MNLKKLKNLAQKNEKLLDKLAKSYSRKLVSLLPVILNFVRANRQPDGLLAPMLLNRQIVSDLLIRAGLPLWGQFNDELEIMGRAALDNLALQGLNVDFLAGGQGALLQALGTDLSDLLGPIKEDIETQMTRTIDSLLLSVKSGLEQMQVASIPITTLAADIGLKMNIAQSQAQTLLNTGLAAIQREINISVGEKLNKIGVDVLYVYQGPQDTETRDFCKPLVGRAYKAKDIARMSNGQGLNVFKYGGGYNCRHNWFAMSKTAIEAAEIERGDPDDWV